MIEITSTKFFMAQLFGLLALIFNIITVHFKTKEKILICSILSNLVVTIEFFLLNAITGAIVSIINLFRCIIFYFYKKKNKKPSLLILILFEIIVIISGAISYQNIWSLIPIIATVSYTYGLWQDDVKRIKYISAIIALEWSIYNIIVMAYVGSIQGVVQFISSIIAIIRYNHKYNRRSNES